MKRQTRLFFITALFVAPLFISPYGITKVEGRGFEGHPNVEAIQGPRGNTVVEGPRGNIAIGTRFNQLPESANPVIIQDQTYYLDENGAYYLPCDDDDTVYCVVQPPQDN